MICGIGEDFLGYAFRALVPDIARALRRSRAAILSVAVVHALAIIVGILMVHTGNEFALEYGDDLVSRARSSDPASFALQRDDRLNAALLDFRANLLLGALPLTGSGLAVVTSYPIAAYRAWVGGIVSVDRDHASRLAEPREAIYYLLTLALQLIPYTLAGGVGINVGWAYFRPQPHYVGDKWLGYPKEAVFDALRVYLLIVPLLLVASLWEFLAR